MRRREYIINTRQRISKFDDRIQFMLSNNLEWCIRTDCFSFSESKAIEKGFLFLDNHYYKESAGCHELFTGMETIERITRRVIIEKTKIPYYKDLIMNYELN